MNGRVATLSRISSSRRLPGLLINHYLLAIAGSVDEPVLKVTVNDAAVAVAGQAFSLGYLLAEGRDTLTVTAMDRAGNLGALTPSVRRSFSERGSRGYGSGRIRSNSPGPSLFGKRAFNLLRQIIRDSPPCLPGLEIFP